LFVRGGIYTNIVAEHRKKGWRPAAPVALPDFEPATGAAT
jgi:7-cyano-7-deazaguanine reductase